MGISSTSLAHIPTKKHKTRWDETEEGHGRSTLPLIFMRYKRTSAPSILNRAILKHVNISFGTRGPTAIQPDAQVREQDFGLFGAEILEIWKPVYMGLQIYVPDRNLF